MACDESIVRITENLKNLKHKLVQLVTKKRKDEEKGFYSYMRKNKKNFRIRQSETSLMAKMKRFKEYEEEQPYHTRTKSFQRLKT